MLVLGPVADDRLARVADRSRASLGWRATLLAMTALAASRMVWVERKFCSSMIVVASGKASLELEDVADVGAPEPVDRLVGVADDARRCGAPPASSMTSSFWAWLVSWYSSTRMWREALLVVLEHVGVRLEQAGPSDQQVVEVHGVGRQQPLLVLGRRRRRSAGRRSAPAPPRGTSSESTSSDLAWLMTALHRPGRELLGVDAELAQR